MTLTFNLAFRGASPASYEWRLYEDDPAAGVIGTVELDGAENETVTTISYLYNYTTDTPVVMQVIAFGWVELLFSTTLLASNQTFPLTIELDDAV